MARAKRIAKWVGFGLAGLIAVTALALGLAYAYGQSAGGRAWIAERLAQLLSEPGRIEVAIEGLTGRLPQAPRIAELRVRDPHGTWLIARNFQLDWHPLALFTGTLHVSRLEIQRLGIERPPESPPGTEDESGAVSLPALPVELRVERLTVAEVALGEAVLGTPAAFRIEGVAATEDSEDLSAGLLVTRSDGVPGRIEADARYSLSERRLALNLDVSEPAGGLIARALDIAGVPAVDVHLTGDGPLDAWDGRLTVALAGLARLEADAKLVLGTDAAFRITGRADSERPFEELPWLLVSGGTTFGIDGRWSQTSTLVIDQARLESAAVDLSLAGRLDTGSFDLEAEARAQVKDHTVLASLVAGAELHDLSVTAAAKGSIAAPTLRLRAKAAGLQLPGTEAGELSLTAETSGPLRQPNLQLAVEIARLVTAGASAERVTAEVEFAPEAPLDRAPLSGRIAASGTAEPVRLEVAADWQPALGQRLAWRLDGRVDLGAAEITADQLSIATETLQVTGSGRYDLEPGSARAELEAAYPDLGTLAALLETEVAGHARLAASVTVGGFGETLSAELSGELQDLVLGEPVAQALFAGRARFDAELSLAPAEGLRLRKLAVETGAATVTGNALLGPDFGQLEASYWAEVEDLNGPGTALGQALGGSAKLEGRVEGALDSLGLSGRLTVAQAALDGRRLGELHLDYQARNLPRQPAGRLDAMLSGPLGEFSAKTRFLYDGAALDLSELSLEGNRTQVRGHARIPVAGGPVVAEISAQAETLEPWLALAGVAAAGRGQAQVTLTADGSRQAAALEGAFDDLAIRLEDGATLRISRLEAELKSEDLLGARRATAALTAWDLDLSDELALRTIKAEAAGGPAGGTVSLSAAGKWYGELQLQTEGQVSVSEDTLSLQVSRLDGRALGETTRLQRPLHITRSAKAWEVADLDLAYGAARLSGAARLGAERVWADLSAAHFPIEALEPFLGVQSATGLADASIQIDGPPAALTGRMTLNAAELRLAALEDGPVLGLTLKGDWRTGRLAVAGRLSGLAEEDAVLSAALPLRLDAATLTPSVPLREALSGRLTWQGPLEPIWALVPITGQTLAGAAKLQVELSGTLERPEVTGRLAIQEGEYENFEMGTLLRDLELLIDLEGQRAMLTKLTARDGGSGSLSASGAIDLLPEQGFPTELTAEFKTFHLLRRDDVTASSSGRLQLQGTARSAKLTGRFETDVVEVRIPDRLPAEIVDLEAVEEGAGLPAAAALPPGVAEDRRFQLPLDLRVEMPRRVFLRGRGLDSEWAGKLAVAGTAERPEVTGKLEMVRGQIAALGKTFKFERGSVDFVGGDTIDPVLDMKAEHAGKDLSVTVQVSGRASDPSISFGSSPDLPEDEIVSRLLFGKTTTQLSAFEAAQLASTAAELSGGGVSGGMLEGLRKLLGVDVLRIETAGDGDAASTGITAGTYVTEEIYVGATQGTAADSGTVEVEVEVSPHIFIDTEVGQTGESNVGIKFKWDY